MIGQSLGHEHTKTTDIYLDDIGDPIMDNYIGSIINLKMIGLQAIFRQLKLFAVVKVIIKSFYLDRF